jgi:hypothetical protein
MHVVQLAEFFSIAFQKKRDIPAAVQEFKPFSLPHGAKNLSIIFNQDGLKCWLSSSSASHRRAAFTAHFTLWQYRNTSAMFYSAQNFSISRSVSFITCACLLSYRFGCHPRR